MTDDLLDLAQRISARPQGRALLELLAGAGEDADAFLDGALRLFRAAKPHESPAFMYLGTFPTAPLEVLADPGAGRAEIRFAARAIRSTSEIGAPWRP